jgi:hypothetical protein
MDNYNFQFDRLRSQQPTSIAGEDIAWATNSMPTDVSIQDIQLAAVSISKHHMDDPMQLINVAIQAIVAPMVKHSHDLINSICTFDEVQDTINTINKYATFHCVEHINDDETTSIVLADSSNARYYSITISDNEVIQFSHTDVIDGKSLSLRIPYTISPEDGRIIYEFPNIKSTDIIEVIFHVYQYMEDIVTMRSPKQS